MTTRKSAAKSEAKKAAAQAPAYREPTENERKAIAEAAAALTGNLKEPPRIAARLNDGGGIELDAPHSEAVGWSAQMTHSLGVSSGVLAGMLQGQLLNIYGRANPATQEEVDRLANDLREGMAFVQGIAPRNEMEAMLAVQMYAAQLVTMRFARLTMKAAEIPQAEANGALFNKSARTFAMMADTLQRVRTGGKQTHEVRYVYVDARTQTVVNAGDSGGRGVIENGRQSQALPFAPGAPVPPMWGENAGGEAVPSPGGSGEEALPDARRH